MEPLVSSIIAVASNMAHSKQQMVLLNQAKSVTEAVLQFVHTTKECRGNPKVKYIFYLCESIILVIFFIAM